MAERFVEQNYLKALAKYYNDRGYEVEEYGPDWTAAKVEAAINELTDYTVQEHLAVWGSKQPLIAEELFGQEGFEESYLEGLAKFYNDNGYAYTGNSQWASVSAGEWTATNVVYAIEDSGETVQSHFVKYANRQPILNAVNAVSSGEGSLYVLEDGQDNLTGTANDDTFLATQQTLQTGDHVDGASGEDVLKLSVNADNEVFTTDQFFAAPTLRNVEKISVNSPNNQMDSIELDLSNSDGYNTLESYQVTNYYGVPAYLGFYDIQNVNGTDIRIIDTNSDHFFTYDTNAYLPDDGIDSVDLYLSEVDGSVLGFGNDRPLEYKSNVDQINITSDLREQVNTTDFNNLDGLYVGDDLYTVMIDGNADLSIWDFLDKNVNLVDARELAADLTLNLQGQGQAYENEVHDDPTLTFYGAQGDDDIFILGGSHNVAMTGTGDDMLTIEGDGVHDINLGEGDDLLNIFGNVDDLTTEDQYDGTTYIYAEDGDDTVNVNSGSIPLADVTTQEDYEFPQGDYYVELGAGDDELYLISAGDHVVDAGAGNDFVGINSYIPEESFDHFVDAGAGNDTVEIFGDGNHEVYGQEGEDDIFIYGTGDQTIDAGTEDDLVEIVGDGVHNITLGDGDDELIVDGNRTPEGNIDYAGIDDLVTTIDAGAGDDVVELQGDHYLDADLGEGDDQIILHAQHLTADDVIAAGEGRDTMSLLNESGYEVTVGASETSSTTSVEVFDLWDSNMTLKLTSDNFDTAEDKDVTVSTVNSNSSPLPEISYEGITLSQGMSREDYDILRDAWNNDPDTSGTLEDYLLSYVEAIDFTDGDNSGDGYIYDDVNDTYTNNDEGDNDQPELDTVFFYAEPGEQTIDIRDIPMSIASNRSFTLDGGNVKDVLIADDMTINGRQMLNFDANDAAADSIQDTLVVKEAATVTAADLRNVNGLEIIELQSSDNSSDTWNIELSDKVINQTTGSSDLIIRVDPEVPAGSKVNIQLDESVKDATSDVVIETVGNADIYIDGQRVNEPDYGTTDYNPNNTLHTITVNERLYFTTNTDSLVGTGGDDMFFADSVDQIQEADSADGLGGDDTLQLNFAVSNPNQSLYNQLNRVSLTSIENIVFDTGMNVEMTNLGIAIQSLTTGAGDDNLIGMPGLDGNTPLYYNLGGGDDEITLSGRGEYVSVDGGLGDDKVTGSDEADKIDALDVETIKAGDGNDTIDATNVEEIYAGSGDDEITIRQTDDEGNIFVDGGYGEDTLDIDGSIDGTVYAFDVEGIIDSDSANQIIAFGDEVSVEGNGGDDTIAVLADEATVNGGDGEDEIFVYAGLLGPVGTTSDDIQSYSVEDFQNYGSEDLQQSIDDKAYVNGQGDDDLIEVFSHWNATVFGGGGDDTIDVWAYHHATVYGDDRGEEGNDIINVYVNDDATIDGGPGDDEINVNYIDAGGSFDKTADIVGGEGNDTINVEENYFDENGSSLAFANTIDSGLGQDEINLDVIEDGAEDTIEFGDIEYDEFQEVDTDATTQNYDPQAIPGQDEVEGYNDGKDIINGFNFENGGPGAEDVLDFTAFLDGSVTKINYADWTNGTPKVEAFSAGGNIAVIEANDDFMLDASHIETGTAGTDNVRIGDNGKGLVLVGKDTNDDNNFDQVDAYYVQDVDQNVDGQAWAVDLIGTINAATEIGAIESIDMANFA